VTRVPTLHAYLPYRGSELVTGEAVHLVPISRRDDSDPGTVEDVMRRLREMCRLTAFLHELEVAATTGGQEAVQRLAAAQAMLDGMFRRAGDDLRHLRARHGSSLSERHEPSQEHD
jgi:hypothetical protein